MMIDDFGLHGALSWRLVLVRIVSCKCIQLLYLSDMLHGARTLEYDTRHQVVQACRRTCFYFCQEQYQPNRASFVLEGLIAVPMERIQVVYSSTFIRSSYPGSLDSALGTSSICSSCSDQIRVSKHHPI